MTDAKRVSQVVADLKLSLEALSTVGKRKRVERSLGEAMAAWRDKPLEPSPELQFLLAPKDEDGQD